ncbi:M1 family peptidase [Lacihabitans sp. LS3-19]|uniref:M1 family metallopeptidase n=1 Tax=Lacihabitans sp. LS3-19 TaxID=2487335 RepID=UPI0020CE1249|nr:M1 family metallopeptidase [Lacihabitans sp. LS3-19]MCP9770854.1 M1 family peptidase [Lacihabitans sp. LS3-19]
MKKGLLGVFVFCFSFAYAQIQKSNDLVFDLIHTELNLKPSWNDQTLNGKAVLTLKPHFYEQDKLVLNAKGFIIQSIKVNATNSEYVYDNELITISLNKKYSRKDTLKISIEYTAQPEKIKASGSDAILSDKGLYFINPKNEKSGLPQQFWTQGETQANSCWFPTIDSPNQKHTQDIYLNIESDFTTLSNGLLVDTKTLNNGTKIDHWQQKEPHAVYLTMIAAGNFKKVVDSTFKRFEVSYFVEPEYEKYAYGIFGRTPEMIKFYEDILGVKYQWDKYAQIPVRKYVSGAMENTTATVHSKTVLKNNNQLIDGNDDGVIAHELFHHWFGDLVTCESWSQLPLNESFANYSEFLWATHKYGKDEGDNVYLNALQEYLYEASQKQVPLIRFNYANREDMFDAHSYQKGGRVLHQLRMEVGDEAFFLALNDYLKSHAFKTAEIEDLRISFEKITGRDLKSFFDQWFFVPGHPRLQIIQNVDDKKLQITVNQMIDSTNLWVYNLKLPVQIFEGNKIVNEVLEINSPSNTFSFDIEGDIKNVLVNPDGYFLGNIDHIKTEEELIFQFYNSKSIYGRIFALETLTFTPEDVIGRNPLQNEKVRNVVLDALKDSFWRIRQIAVQKLFDYDGDDFLKVEKALQHLIKYDPKSIVKADGILAVKNFLNPQNDVLFRAALSDSSNTVKAAGLEALFTNKVADSEEIAERFKSSYDNTIFAAVANYYSENPSPELYDWYVDRLMKMEGVEVYQYVAIFGSYLAKSEKETQIKAVPMLRNLAIIENEWFVRVSAAQILEMLRDDLPEAETALKEVIEKEKDERLINYYEQFKK